MGVSVSTGPGGVGGAVVRNPYDTRAPNPYATTIDPSIASLFGGPTRPGAAGAYNEPGYDYDYATGQYVKSDRPDYTYAQAPDPLEQRRATQLSDFEMGSMQTPAQQSMTEDQLLRAQDSNRFREEAASSIMSAMNSPGFGGGAGGGGIASVSYPDTSAARAATFNAAKDQAGQVAAAALRTLRGQAAATGRLGSGSEATQERLLADRARSGLVSVTRGNEQADLAAQQHEADVQNQDNIVAAQLAAERQRMLQQSLLSLMSF